MTLSEQQKFALDQMGIPIWVLRHEQTIENLPEPLPQSDETQSVDFSKAWLIITEKSLTMSEMRLLRAIFASIQIEFEEIALLQYQDDLALRGFSAETSIALILGEALSKRMALKPHVEEDCLQFDNTLPALVSPSMRELLEQPHRKAEMWQIIQHLRNLKGRLLD